MNLLQLKYAVEVAATASITKAAENLYMGQPNLSRAIRELEEELGVDLFRRTSRGIVPTAQGEAFLERARAVLRQMEALEQAFGQGSRKAACVSFAAPFVGYAASAFAGFAASLPPQQAASISYRETSVQGVVDFVAQGECRLGMVRYCAGRSRYFERLFAQRGLVNEALGTFACAVLVSQNCPLASQEAVEEADLAQMLEIVPDEALAAEAARPAGRRRAYVYGRSAWLEMIKQMPHAYLWTPPLPQQVLDRYGFVMKPAAASQRAVCDVLLYKKGVQLSQTDCDFVTALRQCAGNER